MSHARMGPLRYLGGPRHGVFFTGYVIAAAMIAGATLGPLAGLYLSAKRADAGVGAGDAVAQVVQFGVWPAAFLAAMSLHIVYIGPCRVRPGFPFRRSTRLLEVVQVQPSWNEGRVVIHRKNGTTTHVLNVPGGIFSRNADFAARAAEQLQIAIEHTTSPSTRDVV